MPKRGRTKSASLEQIFIEWLQTIGSMPFKKKSILKQYMQRNKGSDWEELKSQLRTNKVDWWVFLRGKMSADDVDTAKNNYVSDFVFICEEEPSEPYISSLLEIEECQLKLRITESVAAVTCPDCKKKDIEIRALRNQIRHMNEEVTFDARIELMREEFRRAFKHDPFGRLQISIARSHGRIFAARNQRSRKYACILPAVGVLFARHCSCSSARLPQIFDAPELDSRCTNA